MNRQKVALTGGAAWLAEAQQVVTRLGFEPAHYTAQANYITRLAEDYAAAVIVDGDAEGWAFWATTPKTSPATRRIPVIVITAAQHGRISAERAGADFWLAAADIPNGLEDLLRSQARTVDPQVQQALSTACDQPLPAQALEAIALFNQGEYYKQHDLLEALWMAETGPVRDLYRAILQVGVAYYQVTRGNRGGALKMLLRSMQWLVVLPPVCQGVDIEALRADAAQVRAALEALPADADLSGFDYSLLRPVRLVDQA